jgi:D-sedoheptulose 7-phosphate isomerase
VKHVPDISSVVAQLRDMRARHLAVMAQMETVDREAADAIVGMVEHLMQGATLYAAGNGGTAGDLTHFVAELVSGFMSKAPRRVKAFSLTTNECITSALCNDLRSSDPVFKYQVETVGDSGDILLVVTTSGKSPNVILAAEAARARGMLVVAITGGDASRLDDIAHYTIKIPSHVVLIQGERTRYIQEAYQHLLHGFAEIIERALLADAV